MAEADIVHVRYLVNDVAESVEFYTRHFAFTARMSSPAFGDVFRGNLRLLLAGPQSSAGVAMTDGERPVPGGWNRIHLHVEDLEHEVARLTAAGVRFRNEIVTGPGGSQALAVDPSGNFVELFQPAVVPGPASPPPALDHLALAVPDVEALAARLTQSFGMVVEQQFDGFAVLADPRSGLKFELARSADADVHLRHLAFRADDVDGAHATLVAAGMASTEAPVRQDFAAMYQSRLQDPVGLEVQLVHYD